MRSSKRSNTSAAPRAAKPDPLRLSVDLEANRALDAHCHTHPRNEVCGVLVGFTGEDKQGAWTRVAGIIVGKHAREEQMSVTFTHETWEAVHAALALRTDKARVIGWYHTHPDFGIFYSTPDLFVHRNFFGAKGQVGIVIDPIRKERGVFANTAQGLHLMQRYEVSRNGKQGHFVHCSYAAEPLRDALPAATAAAHSQSESSAFTASSLDSIEANLARMERQNHNMLRLLLCWIPLAILIAFGAGLFVGSRMFASQVTVSVSQKDVEAIMGGNGAGTDGKSKESSGKVVK